jgi:hypothetical protein
MAPKWLSAAIVLGCLACGTAKADVTYTFFDVSDPATVDLEFTVTEQLSHTPSQETFLNVGGVLGSDFAAGSALYSQRPPTFLPIVTFFSGDSMFFGNFVFTSFPTGDPSNGAPGDGVFPGQGLIGALGGGTIASLGSATVSGVPEPATWALLGLGFVGLATRRLLSRLAGTSLSKSRVRGLFGAAAKA